MTLKPKLRTYIKLKEHFETEEYTKWYCSRCNRPLLGLFYAVESDGFKSIQASVFCAISMISKMKYIWFVYVKLLYNHIRIEMYNNILHKMLTLII